MTTSDITARTRQRFLEALRDHFRGWLTKATQDFTQEAYAAELEVLRGDPVYADFGFATPEYTLIRLMGRMSISIGRRLGEIYDTVPRFVAVARFGLAEAEATGHYGDDDLRLDMRIPIDKLSEPDKQHVLATVAKHVPGATVMTGLGIEIRYNFNPADSARLRKDELFAGLLARDGLTPIYLIFSGISPRDEAIERLKRAGWNFLIGGAASQFTAELTTMDLASILKETDVAMEVEREIAGVMTAIYDSSAFRSVLQHRAPKA